MREENNRNWVGRVAMVVLCLALLIAIGWGIYSVLARLNHYGENASVGNRENQIEETTEKTPLPESVLFRNTYETDGFYEEDGIRLYNADDAVGTAGIDVSAFQPEIEWETVKQAGIDFAMIRLGYRGYSTGKLDLDDCFLKHMDGALGAGLEVGVYFFSQALTAEEAVEEAEYVLTWLEGYEITYPVIFDWEEVEGPARTDHMNMVMLTSCAEAFCKRIEEGGYKAGVYFNQVYGYEQLNLVSLKDYVFWLAEYSPTPTFAYDFEMWQYTNEGSVPGIQGPVDMNICFKKQ